MRILSLAITGSLTGFLLGCQDPYSQHRIQLRTSQIAETTADIQQREAAGARRLQEADKTLRKWWKSDSERFNRKAPTIGDYFW